MIGFGLLVQSRLLTRFPFVFLVLSVGFGFNEYLRV